MELNKNKSVNTSHFVSDIRSTNIHLTMCYFFQRIQHIETSH